MKYRGGTLWGGGLAQDADVECGWGWGWAMGRVGVGVGVGRGHEHVRRGLRGFALAVWGCDTRTILKVSFLRY